MKLKLTVLVLIGISWTSNGCSLFENHAAGALVAYVKITDIALRGPVRGKTGCYYYSHPSAEAPTGTILSAYCYDQGNLEHSIEGSIEDSVEIFKQLRQIDLKPFSYAEALELAEIAKNEAEDTDLIITLDGSEAVIVIVTSQGRLRIRDWNPGTDISQYAPYNVDIGKLKQILDLLDEFVGDRRLARLL